MTAPGFPKRFSDYTRLYARPIGLGPKGQGASLPLAGGPLSFNSLQIILSAQGRRIFEGPFPVSSLDDLGKNLPPALSETLKRTVSRLTSPRPAIAGLSFETPKIMGILNLTPDSFSDGGDYLKDANERVKALFKMGADIVDAGAESTRPGAKPVSPDEEMKRLKPFFKALSRFPGPVSIDTRKAAVMTEAIKKGALLINDVSALTYDEKALSVAKKAKGVVLMHAKGTPEDMQKDPAYADVLLEVYDYLEGRIEVCEKAGISRNRVMVDPGIGFGKTLEHNLALLKGLSLFQGLGVPVLVGVSRKRFIGEITGISEPKDRVSGSVAAALYAVSQGVQVVRVHDVAETRAALDVYQSITSFG